MLADFEGEMLGCRLGAICRLGCVHGSEGRVEANVMICRGAAN